MNKRTRRKKGKEPQNKKTYAPVSGNRPVITVDYEKYGHFLEGSDLTEAQKQEFLQTLWNIIVEFVSVIPARLIYLFEDHEPGESILVMETEDGLALSSDIAPCRGQSTRSSLGS